MSGGVTTSLALPGSGNLMGGEALAIKLRPVSTLSVEDMQVSAGADESEEKIWRYMKMACGENPKWSYGYAEGAMPLTSKLSYSFVAYLNIALINSMFLFRNGRRILVPKMV